MFLFVPNDLKSRNDVDIEREFSFKWSSERWKGVPLIAANMDTTGTFEVYQVLLSIIS